MPEKEFLADVDVLGEPNMTADTAQGEESIKGMGRARRFYFAGEGCDGYFQGCICIYINGFNGILFLTEDQ
jgi:hypothetical protein